LDLIDWEIWIYWNESDEDLSVGRR
jgi:hypothetical protein